MLKDLCLVLFPLHTLIHLHFLGVLSVRILSIASNKNKFTPASTMKNICQLIQPQSSGIATSRDLGNVIGISLHSIMLFSTLLTKLSDNFSSSDGIWQLQACIIPILCAIEKDISLFQVLKQNVRISSDWTGMAWLKVNIHL